jgi:hypothetical protein
MMGIFLTENIQQKVPGEIGIKVLTREALREDEEAKNVNNDQSEEKTQINP